MATLDTWLITGSSRGFGRALSVAALEAGDQVVATARTPTQLADLVERYGEQILTVELDVTNAAVGGTAGLGSYQAAKFAVDGLTRVLAAETGPFGIRYLVVEPGGFATDWSGASMEIQAGPEEYQPTVGLFALLAGSGRLTAGDPKRAGEILVRLVKHDELPGHLLLGAGAARMAIDYSRDQIAEATAWQEVSASADFDAPYPAELPGKV